MYFSCTSWQRNTVQWREQPDGAALQVAPSKWKSRKWIEQMIWKISFRGVSTSSFLHAGRIIPSLSSASSKCQGCRSYSRTNLRSHLLGDKKSLEATSQHLWISTSDLEQPLKKYQLFNIKITKRGLASMEPVQQRILLAIYLTVPFTKRSKITFPLNSHTGFESWWTECLLANKDKLVTEKGALICIGSREIKTTLHKRSHGRLY